AGFRPTSHCTRPLSPRDMRVRLSPRQCGPVGDVRAAKASGIPVRLCMPVCHPPSPPVSRSTALAPGVPWRRPPHLSHALTCRRRQLYTEAMWRPGGGGSGGTLPQTPEQKCRLFYLSVHRSKNAVYFTYPYFTYPFEYGRLAIAEQAL